MGEVIKVGMGRGKLGGGEGQGVGTRKKKKKKPCSEELGRSGALKRRRGKQEKSG